MADDTVTGIGQRAGDPMPIEPKLEKFSPPNRYKFESWIIEQTIRVSRFK